MDSDFVLKIVAGVITAAIIGMSSWTMVSVNTLGREVAILQTDLRNINNGLVASSTRSYSQQQANSDRALLEQKIETNEAKIERLETRIERIEGRFER